MTQRAKLLAVGASAALYLFLVVVGLGAAVWSEADPGQREVISRLLADQAGVLFWGGVLAVVGLGLIVLRFLQPYLVRVARLTASTRLIAAANPSHRLDVSGPAELRALALAVNQLADRYQGEQADVTTRIASARADLDAERTRLAALMSDLTVAVLVCNAEGRILLYNAAASQLLNQPGPTGGLVGLGRSVFGIVDRGLLTYALDRIGDGTVTSHQAIVPRGDQLLRAHVATVASTTPPDQGADPGPAVTGFVITLEDLTRQAAATERRDSLLRALTVGSRAPVANIRAAVENMIDYPEMDSGQKTRFLQIALDEATTLSRRMDDALAESSTHPDEWLAPADMLGRDLLDTITRSLRQEDLRVTVEERPSPIWLTVDGYAVVRAVAHLGRRLHHDHGTTALRLRLGRAGGYARLDLCWAGAPIGSATLAQWLRQPLDSEGAGLASTVAEVLDRHGGEAWGGEDDDTVYLRILLPLAAAEAAPPSRTTPVERPHPGSGAVGAAYDFSLLEATGDNATWAQRRLDQLTYTVVDTETTGLFPTEGDEIISIGAVRIVNRRLLRQEAYEQLVDPLRSVPEASIRIHGIEPALLHGQPTIDQVLPVFADYVGDTVLVGHNVAFDMQFLRLKRNSSGVSFTQPVLDTLLLSAVVHPEHASHSLDDIAERLGIDVIGRHTALGDAILTGEVFLRLLALLGQQGITTLGEARDAARVTFQSRFSESLYAGD